MTIFDVMGDLRPVDAVVAENGAVIALPASGRSVALAPTVSEHMLMELRRRGIEARVGACLRPSTVTCDATISRAGSATSLQTLIGCAEEESR